MLSCFWKFYPQLSSQLKGGLLPAQMRPGGGGNMARQGGWPGILCPGLQVVGAQGGCWCLGFESGVGPELGYPRVGVGVGSRAPL